MAKNKVEFGISNLHVFTYDDSSTPTVLGTPYHQEGAVNFAPEQDADNNVFYADNIAFWSEYNEGPFEGDLEVAKFDDNFKLQFLGYKQLANGGLAQVKGATKPKVCIAFEIEGDVEKRRACFYNCSLGVIGREYATIEDSKEPATETLGITCVGDKASGVTKATFTPDDPEYNVLFTSPTVPEIESES